MKTVKSLHYSQTFSRTEQASVSGNKLFTLKHTMMIDSALAAPDRHSIMPIECHSNAKTKAIVYHVDCSHFG